MMWPLAVMVLLASALGCPAGRPALDEAAETFAVAGNDPRSLADAANDPRPLADASDAAAPRMGDGTGPGQETMAPPAPDATGGVAPDEPPTVKPVPAGPKLPPLFRPMFHKLAKLVYQMSYDLPAPDGNAARGPRAGKHRITCQPSVHVFASGAASALTCSGPEGAPPLMGMDIWWCASARGLSQCDSLDSEAEVARATEVPWLAAEPVATTGDGFVVTRQGKRWCREDRHDQVVERYCFEPGRGLVSVSLDTPSVRERYQLVGTARLPEAGDVLFASESVEGFDVIRMGELGLEPLVRVDLPGGAADVAFAERGVVAFLYGRRESLRAGFLRDGRIELLPDVDPARFSVPKPAGQDVHEALERGVTLMAAGDGEVWVSRCAWLGYADGLERCERRAWVQVIPPDALVKPRTENPYPGTFIRTTPGGYRLEVKQLAAAYEDKRGFYVPEVRVLLCSGPKGRSRIEVDPFDAIAELGTVKGPTGWLEWLSADPPIYAVTQATGADIGAVSVFAACDDKPIAGEPGAMFTVGPRGLWRMSENAIMLGRDALSAPDEEWPSRIWFAP